MRAENREALSTKALSRDSGTKQGSAPTLSGCVTWGKLLHLPVLCLSLLLCEMGSRAAHLQGML